MAGHLQRLTRGGPVRGGADRIRALLAPSAVAMAVAGGVALVALVDPNRPGHYPPCPFLVLTGWYCPGCGTLRAIHALAHGDVGTALGLNVLSMACVPIVLAGWGYWVIRAYQGRPIRANRVRPAFIWAFLALAVVFWIVRNLSFGQFLAP